MFSTVEFSGLAFAFGIDDGFDIRAFAIGFSDCVRHRPHSDGSMTPFKMTVVVPPIPHGDHPYSYQESYRLGWLYALQCRN